MSARALIIDDEAHIRELIEMTLTPLGVHCNMAENLGQAHALLKNHSFDFAITDMRLPDGNGLELVEYIQKTLPNLPIAVITAHGNVESAVASLKLGAFDFISKPFEISTLRSLANTAMKMAASDAAASTNATSSADASDDDDDNKPKLLGQSAAMDKVRLMIRKLARSQAPILISGESGTGKELGARLVHLHGPRSDGPFIPVNCGAIPEHLMESEFFGYKKGSFTGATADKDGLFQAAKGGTLFLDEVADLPQHMQVKMLRAIQERAVRPIGAQAEVPVDVRILSATHKDLAQLVDDDGFRQDLYYRLNVIELRMPSLRERPDDTPELADFILHRLSENLGLEPPNLSPEALEALMGYPFPGNIRELENTLERASTLCEDDVITPQDLQLPGSGDMVDYPGPVSTASHSEPAQGADSAAAAVPEASESGLENYLEELERDAIMKALEATRFNKTAAAEKLGISFRALRYRLKKLGLD